MRPPASEFTPIELAGNTVESLFARHGANRPWVYWTVLSVVLAALVALPLVKVDLSVRAPGVVRPATERVELRIAAGGAVARVLASDNDSVTAGQTLLELATPDLDERLARNRNLQISSRDLIADLEWLVAAGASVPSSTAIPAGESVLENGNVLRHANGRLRTPALREERRRLDMQLESGRLAAARARAELERISVLAAKGIATQRELDDARYALARTEAESGLLLQQAITNWQARLREERGALEDLLSADTRLNEERAMSIVRAPVTGTVQGLSGLAEGRYVGPGQSLGVISPDERLLIEVLVPSSAIGFIRAGQAVRIQVEAFPYTQWGLLDGIVVRVAGDMIPMPDIPSNGPGQALFKVVVEPIDTSLRLPNGIVGEIQKGFAVNARFIVARRSLLEVLHEDLSEWLDPHGPPRKAKPLSRQFRWESNEEII